MYSAAPASPTAPITTVTAASTASVSRAARGRRRDRCISRTPGGPAGTARSTGRSRRGSADVDTAKVREWAKGQGIEVKNRGRVPAGIIEQYQTAAEA